LGADVDDDRLTEFGDDNTDDDVFVPDVVAVAVNDALLAIGFCATLIGLKQRADPRRKHQFAMTSSMTTAAMTPSPTLPPEWDSCYGIAPASVSVSCTSRSAESDEMCAAGGRCVWNHHSWYVGRVLMGCASITMM
jgi:hypothetical protein